MNLHLVRRAIAGPAIFLCVACCSMSVPAQSSAPTYGGSKFLVIQREFTKPGRDGTPHEATEAAYMRAAAAGKAPFHYVAMVSMSGPNRALFLESYPTLEAVEADRKQMGAALQASLDKAMVADGDLLMQQDSSVWMVDPELSQNTDGPRVGSRYMVVREFVIKPGHTAEWEQLVKIVKDGHAKAGTGAHWTAYKMIFGNSTGSTYLVLTAVKSMNELDDMFSDDPRFAQAVGTDGLKQLDSLEAACMESSHTNLFAIDPKMSIPTDDMVKAEPDFWRAKPTSATVKKSAMKPVTSSGQ